MKLNISRTVFFALGLIVSFTSYSQQDPKTTGIKPVDPLKNRPADHLVLQFGYDGWSGGADSIKTKGFGRHFNAYMMFDKPIKNHKHLSLAYGLGLGSSNIYFNNQIVNLAGTGATLPFTTYSNGDHFKRFKLTNIYVEVPLEIRYYEKPRNTNSGWKAALGIKGGLLIKSYTKGKDWQNASGSSYYGKTYTQKVSNKRYINGNKVSVFGRIGYGAFSLHGEYNLLGSIKDGLGPTVNAYSVGLSIGGL